MELKRLRTMSLLSEHTDGRLFVDVAGGAEGDSDECVWLYDEKDPGDTTSAVLAARGNY